MNIFYVDHDPVKAAQALVDKHVVKMILESAQLLSTAHRVLDGEMTVYDKYVEGSLPPRYRKTKTWRLHDGRDKVIYSATHINHPSAVWCRTAVENYTWLVDHMYGLMDEYTYRYGKKHKCHGEIAYLLQSPPKNLETWNWTEMPTAMPDEYKVAGDSLTSYRNYYKIGKSKLHAWKNRQPPEWIVT